MPTHQTRIELQEVPLRACCFQNGFCVNTDFVEDDGKLVHKCDINVALTVFNNLRGFRDLNARSSMYACIYNEFINLCNNVQRFFIHTRNNFRNRFKTMHFIARIDTFRRIANLEIHTAFQTRFLFKNGHTNVFRYPRIDRRFKYNNATFYKVSTQNTACSFNGR